MYGSMAERGVLLPVLTGFLGLFLSLGAGGGEAPPEAPWAEKLAAHAVWHAEGETGEQHYLTFRKCFEMSALPQTALFHIFADSRYVLWCNGRYVTMGPCRFDPAFPAYDSLDLRPFLQEGANVLAILAHHYHDGKPVEAPEEFCGRIMRHAPCLTAGLEGRDGQGAPFAFWTDATWRVSNETPYRPSPPSWSSIPDRIDGRVFRGDWRQLDFDDSGWAAASPLASFSWGKLERRLPPLLLEEAVAGLKCLEWNGQALDRPLAGLLPLEVQPGQRLVIDAGRFVQAYSVVEMEAAEGAVLELRYAQSYFHNGRKPGGDYGRVNRYCARAGGQRYQGLDTFGFKYLVIDVKEAPLRLKAVEIVNRRYPFSVVGEFASNDAQLNRLWRMGIETVLQCSEDGYTDCASRERVSWLGDGVVMEYPITRVALAGPGVAGAPVYGDPRLCAALLRHVGQSQGADGRVKAHHPSNRWDIHGYIEDYACLWIHGIRGYYDATPAGGGGVPSGHELARELWPRVKGQLGLFARQVTERGLLRAREFAFPGNPLVYRVCEGATLNAAYYQALKDGAYLAEALGYAEAAKAYRGQAQRLRAAFNTVLWHAEEETCASGCDGAAQLAPSAHAAIFALYFDLPSETQRPLVARWLLEHYQKEDISPYIHQFFLETLYRMPGAATDQLALDLMRRRWDAMGASETGTLWEGFSPGEWCHNMGAAPTWMLSARVLGVQVAGPVRDKRIRIAPHLGDLAWAAGVVVTEFGPVRVSWKGASGGGRFEFSIETPDEVMIELCLPRRGVQGGFVFTSPSEAPPAFEDKGGYACATLKGGRYGGYGIKGESQ